MTEEESNYLKYRGRCKELAEAAIQTDPTLTLVRGYYYCPIWGEQNHWWAKKPDGQIVDPSKAQFPSNGIGEYIEFDGIIPCANCGKEMREGVDEIYYESNYAFCDYTCAPLRQWWATVSRPSSKFSRSTWALTT
jgi:hypothetical protein